MSILVGGMCSLCFHMALLTVYYIVFLICDCFCPFFKNNLLNVVLDARPKRSMVPASPNLFTIFFYESNTEVTNFWIMFVMFYVDVLCMFCIVFNLCDI